jgi:molybdopterin synthase sulfur carrier subunit
MPLLRIPSPLRYYTDGQGEVQVEGHTVGAVMEDFLKRYPALRPHLMDGNGELRHFVNLFLNEQNIRDLQGLETPVAEEDKVMIVPSIAGGR